MELSKTLMLIAFPVIGYLFGSIPWGLVLTKKFTSVDIRQEGSGNIGATNVRRVAGTWLGILTLAGDFTKGLIPVYLATQMAGTEFVRYEIYGSTVALSAFLGHLYPVFLGFRSGGKGVATAAGCFFVLSPFSCIVCIVIFILVVFFSRRVSAASLSAAAILPIAILVFTQSAIMTGFAVVTSAFIYFRHKDNIKRLVSGNEPTLWSREK